MGLSINSIRITTGFPAMPEIPLLCCRSPPLSGNIRPLYIPFPLRCFTAPRSQIMILLNFSTFFLDMDGSLVYTFDNLIEYQSQLRFQGFTQRSVSMKLDQSSSVNLWHPRQRSHNNSSALLSPSCICWFCMCCGC